MFITMENIEEINPSGKSCVYEENSFCDDVSVGVYKVQWNMSLE